jgi:hypothetical protein
MLAAAVTGSTVVVLPAEQLWPPRYKEGQRQWQRWWQQQVYSLRLILW